MVWHKAALQGLTMLVVTVHGASHASRSWAQPQRWAPVVEQPGSSKQTGKTAAAPLGTRKPVAAGPKQSKPLWTGPLRDNSSFSGAQPPPSPRWSLQPQPKTPNPKADWTPQPAGGSSGRTDAAFPLWEQLHTENNQAKRVVWRPVSPDEPALVAIDPAIAAAQIQLPPVPALQALNRSIAFNDRTPGPDLAWKVPQGFRWSEQWFLDFSVAGANTRPYNSNFFAWNNGDAVADLHVRVFQQQRWSFGLNATFRSVYQGNNAAGGTTQIGDGFATGFRLDYALSPTSGIALGGEQVIQYDSNNDSGRNLYLVASKGWWLGGRQGSFPLLVGTAGVGTGRLGDNESLQFGCVEGIDASIGVGQTSPLCWSPIASAALVFNPNWSLFSEYNSEDWLAGASLSGNNGFPMRLSWGVLLGNKGVNYSFVGWENIRWFFRASIGL